VTVRKLVLLFGHDQRGTQGLLSSEDRGLEGLGCADDFRQAPEAEPLERHIEETAGTVLHWQHDSVDRRRFRLPDRDYQWRGPAIRRPPDLPTIPLIEAHEALDRLGIGWFLAVRARRRE
jgi:hypothetical protein